MKKIKLLLGLAVSFALIASLSEAQEIDEPLIIEDSDESMDAPMEQTDESSLAGFRKNFSGELLASYSGLLGKTERTNASLKLRFVNEWDQGLSVVVEGRAYSSNLKLEFERVNLSPPMSNTPQTTTVFNRDVKTSQIELREGYIRFNRDFVDIYLGRRTLAMGQFDAISPVDFVLPIDLSENTVSFSKLEYKYPQTTASIYLYPTPKLELQLHYFPFIERDPVTRALLEVGQNYTNAAGDLQVANFQKPRNESQYIGRLVYTGEKLTLGLTYYRGFDLYPASLPRIILDSNDVPVKNRNRPMPSYPKRTGYGFEMAIPRNRYTLKYEAFISQEYNQLDEFCAPNLPACTDYYDTLNTLLGGRAYTQPNALLHAVGIDYIGEFWTVNLAIFNYISLKDDKAQQALQHLGLQRNTNDGVFPAINVVRRYGRNLSHATGLGGGILGSALGVTLYHGWEATENFKLAMAVEVLQYQGDVQVEEQIRNSENMNSQNILIDVTRVQAFAPALRFGILYTF